MVSKMKNRCTDPQIGQLVDDVVSSVFTHRILLKEEREQVLDHIKACQECRLAMLEHAHKTVTVPTLERIANDKHVRFEEFMKGFTEIAQEMMREGRLEELGRHYQNEVAPDDDRELSTSVATLAPRSEERIQDTSAAGDDNSQVTLEATPEPSQIPKKDQKEVASGSTTGVSNLDDDCKEPVSSARRTHTTDDIDR